MTQGRIVASKFLKTKLIGTFQQALLILVGVILVGGLLILTPLDSRAQLEDVEMDMDMIMSDSIAAEAQAESMREMREQEKQERLQAEREARATKQRAVKKEREAKAQIAVLDTEILQLKKEKEGFEEEIKESLEVIREYEEKVSAAKAEHERLLFEHQKTRKERDTQQAMSVEKRNEFDLIAQQSAEERRVVDELAAELEDLRRKNKEKETRLAEARQRLDQQRRHSQQSRESYNNMIASERSRSESIENRSAKMAEEASNLQSESSASRNVAGSRQLPIRAIKKDCALHKEPSGRSPASVGLKSGQRVQILRGVSPLWLEARTPKQRGFIERSCF